MRKTLKSALSVVLSAAMALTMGSVGSLTNNTSAKAADEATYTAKLGGQMDITKATVGEWDAAAEVSFKLGEEVTLTYDAGDKTGCWSGNFIGIDTDLTYTSDMKVKVSSIKYDGVECDKADLSKVTVGTEDGKTTLRITLSNLWANIESIFSEYQTFNKMEITFAVGNDANPLPEAPADPSAAPSDATEAPSAEPSAAPSEMPTPAVPSDGKPDFNATIKCFGNFYGWDNDTPTDATATVHVSDYGEYSVSFAAPDAFNDLNEMSGAFVVQTDLKGEPATHPFTLLGKTVKIGDASYDWSKATAYLDGDNIRMSARNEWGQEEYANPLAGQIIPINKDDVITFTFEVKEGAPSTPTEAPTVAPTEAPTQAPTEAPAQTYNAYLGFQTDIWDYRDEYEKDFNSKDYDFVNQAVVGGEPTNVDKVKITNASITSDGTYSVSMTGADLSGGTEFKMLYFSTDIPAAMKDVKFSDVKVIIDEKEVITLKDGVLKKEVQDGSKKYYMVMAVNTYGQEGIDLPEAFTYSMPVYSLELQFTVKGLDLGQDYSTKTYGAKKGATFTSGNFKYKVTKAATITAGKTAKGKVEVVGLSAAGKKKTSVSVGTSVNYTSNGEKAAYTISSLGAGAFKGASKLKAVTLSKNIKSIKKDTFKNCKNLSKLALKAKLSSVAKNSFKGCKKTIKVSGTSAKANVKKLVKSGYKKFK